MTTNLTRCLIASVVLLASVQVGGQERQGRRDPDPTFDAAVVKHSDPRGRSPYVPGMPLPGGRWSAQRATLATIVSSTYGIRLDQIVGLPEWARTERYDIVATAGTNATGSELQSMAKTLLAERFGLRARKDQRGGPVYAIVIKDERGTLGSGLRPTSCDADHQLRGPSPTKKATNPCGTERIASLGDGALRYELRGRSLRDLVTLSSAWRDYDYPLVDRTGLTGTFDIDVEVGPRPAIGAPASVYPPFGVALEEQLGLKVERRIEAIDILVIEAIERPVVD